MLADLHLHSCFSDGTRTPEEVAQAAAAGGIGLAALADHNTSGGYERFAAACAAVGVRPLRGMELDCVFEDRVLHLLAYGFEPIGRVMVLADHSRRLLLEMSRDLIRKMGPDYPQLSLAEYDGWEYDPQLGGWNGLHYLLQKGVTQKLTDGMGLYRQYGCDYSEYPFPSAKAVCQAVRDACGVPVLAHPGNWFANLSDGALGATFDRLRECGVGGIECYYPSHSSHLTAFCLEYCAMNGLLTTAGSDCHGNFNKVVEGVTYRLGIIKVDHTQLRLGRLLGQANNSSSKGTY